METEIASGGRYSFGGMLNSGIEETPEADHVLLDGFKIQEDFEMYIRLAGYDYFRGFDLSRETDLAAISNRVYEGFSKPLWETLKHHLFIAHIPKNLLQALSELCMR